MEIKEEIKLTNYEKNKVAIYKWRNKNLDKYNMKQQEYNKIKYENEKTEIIARVTAYRIKKQLESGLEKRRVGRPSKIYHEIII